MTEPKGKEELIILSWIVVYIMNAAACVLNLYIYASKHNPFSLAVAAASGFAALAFLKGVPNVK